MTNCVDCGKPLFESELGLTWQLVFDQAVCKTCLSKTQARIKEKTLKVVGVDANEI